MDGRIEDLSGDVEFIWHSNNLTYFHDKRVKGTLWSLPAGRDQSMESFDSPGYCVDSWKKLEYMYN